MDRPKVGVGVFIIKDNKILLGKRIGAHGEGTWCLPGGNLEYFESFKDCAKRELLEETGLEIDDINFLTATNDMFKEENKHYVTLFLNAKIIEGELINKEPEKCEQWDWFKWDNFPTPLFLPLINLRKTNFNPINF